MINSNLCFIALEMLHFYVWLRQVLDKMDKDLYWEDVKWIMGEAMRRKLAGKIYCNMQS